MKMKFGTALLVAVFTVAMLAPQSSMAAAEDNHEVRQGELALLLVNVLGLYRFLPASPSEQEAVAVLLANGIAPANGWELDRSVVLADLAVIIVKSIDRADEVINPDDPQSWIDLLNSLGVPIDKIGLALANVEPLPEPVAGNVFLSAVTTDPLKRRAIFGQPDEIEMGADVAYLYSERPVSLPDIEDVVRRIPDIPRRPRPVTPD